MISIIVAIDPNNLIGSNGKLPWDIKEDLKHFKEYTLNKTVLMGYTTYLSIGRPLPHRTNIVCCNDANINIDNVIIEKDAIEVFKRYQNTAEELVVIGGASIYKLALPYASKLVISHIKKVYLGDTYFPEFKEDFNETESKDFEEFKVVIYKRK